MEIFRTLSFHFFLLDITSRRSFFPLSSLRFSFPRKRSRSLCCGDRARLSQQVGLARTAPKRDERGKANAALSLSLPPSLLLLASARSSAPAARARSFHPHLPRSLLLLAGTGRLVPPDRARCSLPLHREGDAGEAEALNETCPRIFHLSPSPLRGPPSVAGLPSS